MKPGRICFLVFVLIVGFGCDKSVDTDEELLGLGSGGSGGTGMGTLISMADGTLKRIEELHIGDMVSSDDGSASGIKNILSGMTEKIYSINTKSGKSILVVGGQPIKSSDGWISANELKVGTLIIGKDGNETIEFISLQTYNKRVYLLQFNVATGFVANGLVIGDFNISYQQ